MRDQDVERVCEQTARTLHALSGRVRGAGTPGAPSAASVSGR
jgi:hypothetical protein